MQRRRLNRTCPGRNWVSSPVACARFDVPLPHSLPPTRQRESKDSLPGCAILERIPQTPTTPTSSPAHRATAPSSCILISPFPIPASSQTHSFPPALASFTTQASRILIPADPFRARFPPAPPPQPPRPPWTSPIPTTRRSGHRPSATFTKLPRTAPADRSPRSRRNPPPAPRRAPYSRFPAFPANQNPRTSLSALHRPIPRLPRHSPTPPPLLTGPQRIAERTTSSFAASHPLRPPTRLQAIHGPFSRPLRAPRLLSPRRFPRIQASSVRKALHGPSRRLALPHAPLTPAHTPRPLVASPQLHSIRAPSRRASQARTASHHRANPDPQRILHLHRCRNPGAAFLDSPCARARESRDARKRLLSCAAAMRIGQPLPTQRCLQALPTNASHKRFLLGREATIP